MGTRPGGARVPAEGPAGEMATRSGPLDPAPRGREAALAERWRRLRRGVPPALYLAGWAVALLLVLAAVGRLLAKVASHDALGREDAGLSRWFAAHRSRDLNQATHWATDLAETPTVTVLAAVVLYGSVALLASQRARSAALRAAAWALAVLVPAAVAFARLYRGMHFVTDVLGGAVLGVTWLV